MDCASCSVMALCARAVNERTGQRKKPTIRAIALLVTWHSIQMRRQPQIEASKLTYSHDTSPEWPTESQKAIMLEAFTLTAVSGQARPSRKLAAARALLRVAHV